MNNALQKPTSAPVTTSRKSALTVMASRYNVEPDKLLNTLKETVVKKATNEQLLSFVVVANEYKLNPFTRQIYAFPDRSGGITPVVSVDGWIAMMTQHEQFDGITFEFMDDQDGNPHACTAIIRRKDFSNPVAVTEYFDECARNTDPWKSHPRRMLRHKALIQCVRVAFGFTAMDPEEAADVQIEQHMEPARPTLFQMPKPAANLAEKNPVEPEDDVPMEFDSSPEPAMSAQDQLALECDNNGVNFELFARAAVEIGIIEDASSLPDFDAVPKTVCEKVLKAKTAFFKAAKKLGKEAK